MYISTSISASLYRLGCDGETKGPCWEAFEPRHFSDLFEELKMDMDMEARVWAHSAQGVMPQQATFHFAQRRVHVTCAFSCCVLHSVCSVCVCVCMCMCLLVVPQDGITLQQMLDVGILDHIDTLERISVKAWRVFPSGVCLYQGLVDQWICTCCVREAQKEHGLKTALATMKKEPSSQLASVL